MAPVLSFNDLFRADASFRKWEFLGRLEARHDWGRPDAMGSYPAVTGGHWLGRDRFLFSTIRDGMILYQDGRGKTSSLPGQFDVGHIRQVSAGPEGILFDGDAARVWRRKPGRMEALSIEPPPRKDVDEWSELHSFMERDGSILVFGETNFSPGPRVVHRWKQGKPSLVFNKDAGDSFPIRIFLTPDGLVWVGGGGFPADGSEGEGPLMRFQGGEWKEVGRTSLWAFDVRVVNRDGPPWFIHDLHRKSFYRFAYKGDGENPDLVPLPLSHDGRERLRILDAIEDAPGRLLLATNGGLLTFRTDTKEIRSLPQPRLPENVNHICRDGRGRLWISAIESDGLWMLDEKNRLHDLSALPVPTGGQITALAADPDDPAGVIAALGSRGVAFLKAE